ncbi:SusE domain-containing protein [uncultured Polaribacter sp.]|uniref:SusE domain-containing protein n=1 Tax=uncultured Polaribacter sp. TaxID=174711 RepID=UPI002628D9A9|nr:SusE domain-containing protein [uncultured Polaribacter sp.]
MKKFLKNIIPIVAFLAIYSCAEDRDDFSINSSVVAPAVVEPSTTTINLVGLQNLPDNPAITLVWNKVDYGVQTPVNYDVEISNTQTFDNVASFSNNNQRTISWTVDELNVQAQKIGLPVEIESDLYVRVVSSLGTDDSVRATSDVITLKVTTYFAYLFDDFYLVGPASRAGWENNNNNPPLFRTEANADKYIYTGYFNADDFKVLEMLGQWQPQWGTDDNVTLAGNPATSSSDPGPFSIAAAGYYTFTYDFANKTFSITTFDDSNSTTYTSITVKGSATVDDIALTQSTFDSHIWYVNGVDLKSGSVNFIDSNGAAWGNDNEFHGTATINGGDIPTTDRNYNISFNDLTGDYMIIPTF